MLGDVKKHFVFKSFFAFTHQANFPANNLNFHWRWRLWDRIQAIFLNLLYFKHIMMTKIQSVFFFNFCHFSTQKEHRYIVRNAMLTGNLRCLLFTTKWQKKKQCFKFYQLLIMNKAYIISSAFIFLQILLYIWSEWRKAFIRTHTQQFFSPKQNC